MPLLWLSLAFLSGLLLADWTGASWPIWAGAAACTILLFFLLRRFARRLPANAARLAQTGARLKLPPLLLLTGLALGGLRYSLAHLPPGSTDVAFYNGQGAATLTGVVIEAPDRREGVTLLRVSAEHLQQPGGGGEHRVRCLVQVMLPPNSTVAYGERLRLTGKLSTPADNVDFSYREYLARQGVYAVLNYPRVESLAQGAGSPLKAALYRLRDGLQAAIERRFPAPESAFISGILLGQDEKLPAELVTAFQRTGTAHILAISGFNLSLLAGFFMASFRKFMLRWWALLAALIALALYTGMVGASPAVLRAAVMSSLALVAAQIGRSAGGLNALFLAAGVMSLFNPDLPWDVSFQLSFTATLGLLLYADRLQGAATRAAQRWVPGRLGRAAAGFLSENLLFTLAAQAFTLPVILYHFGRLSWIAPLANFLVLPVQSSLMLLALLTAAFSVLGPLAALPAAPTWLLSAYTLRVIELLGRFPEGEWITGTGRAVLLLGVYALLVGLALGWRWLRAHAAQLRPALTLLCAAGLAGVLVRQALAQPDGMLRLTMWPIGEENTLLVQAPGGQTLLAGAASESRSLSAQLGRRLPIFDAHLDGLWINAGGAAGLRGFPELIAQYRPHSVFWSAEPPAGAAARALQSTLDERSVPVERLQVGQKINLGAVKVWAPVCVESLCALRVDYQNFAALLPGGLAPAALPSEALRGLTVIIVPETTAQDWQSLPGMPRHTHIAVTGGEWIGARSDGAQLWLEREE